MRDLYLSHLTTFGLGVAIAFAPVLPASAAESLAEDGDGAPAMDTIAAVADAVAPTAIAEPAAPAPLYPAPDEAIMVLPAPVPMAVAAPPPLVEAPGLPAQVVFEDEGVPAAEPPVVAAPAVAAVTVSEVSAVPASEVVVEAALPPVAPASFAEFTEPHTAAALLAPAATELAQATEALEPEAEPATPPEPSVDPAPEMPEVQPEMSPAMPEAELDGEALSEDGVPRPLPEYLQPTGDPLLTPTQPEEVEIVGTQPISLETAVEAAYTNNEALQTALLELERSQAALRQAQAALYPTVDVGGNLQTGNAASAADIVTGTDSVQTSASANVQTRYSLGLSGERQARIRVAEESVRAAELSVEQTRAQLRLDTINDYYTLQNAIEQIRINQAFLDEAQRNLDDAALREEVGLGTRFDVLRAQVQVANARQSVISATSNRRVAQRQLAARLNIPPSINLTTLPVETEGTWPLSLEESIVLAYQNRSELENLLVQREIGEQQRRISLAAVRPDVTLVADYNLQQLLSGSTTGLDSGFSLRAELQWRLFDGGAAAAGARQRELDTEIAETQFSQTRNAIRLEVEQAYFELVANQENISTAQLAVQQAQEAVELANLRFRAGVGTQLDVLTATSELAQAEGNLVTAQLDYNRALAALERAVSNVDFAAVDIAE